MRSHYSIGKNGPGTPQVDKPKKFMPKPLIAANTPINSFAKNGLFQATNISAKSGSKTVNQMIRDSQINRK